jgi:hypothetical protein
MRKHWIQKSVVYAIIILLISTSVVSAFYGTSSLNTPDQISKAIIETMPVGDIIISNPIPANGSLNISLQPKCAITLSHSNGTGMILTWYENSTGLWVLHQTNGSTHWYNAKWKYRKLITIDHTKIHSTLTHFPILISLATDTDLAADAQNDGGDICFIAYADNTTKLNHEIEWFNGATGKLSAWVNIPSISSITNTKIWMYYGNSLVGNQENVAGVWDANYGGVWHMQEINAVDSTDNGNTGSQTGTPIIASGMVNNSVDFTPTDSINVGAGDSINTANDDTLTWECWINGDSNAANQIFLEQSRWINSWNVVLGTYDGDVPGNAIKWITRDDDGSARDTLSSGVSITTGSWMHIAGTYNNGASDNKSIYINGALKASTSIGINNLRAGPTTATHIGYGGDYGPYDGKIDEVRMSSNVRNASWINATYQTIAHPSTFFSMGTEQSLLTNGTYRWIFTQASAHNTRYYWKIIVSDTYKTKSAIYHFTTVPVPNQPPYVPSNPSPANGSTGVSTTIDLGWVGGDPDAGDTVVYDVRFGTTSSPPIVSHNQSSLSYDPGTLTYSTLYYWRIVAWDNHGATTRGPLWHFTTGAQPNQPPYIPSNPSPANGTTGVSINADLGWVGGDPDAGDTVTYDVRFGTTSSPPIVSHNQSSLSYDPGTLIYSTTYYWKIVAWDNHGASTAGPLWHFTTGAQPNQPPYVPSAPVPSNGSTEVSITIDLSWVGGDPDPGDTVTYDVYFGMSSTPQHAVFNQSGLSYDPGTLAYNTVYYWRIVAWDNHGASTAGPLWHFTTTTPPNQPPYIPSNPSPSDGSTGVSITIDLGWIGGDPDTGDSVVYDVYFGTSSTPPHVVFNQSAESYDPGTLAYSTLYYWRIVAWDNHGASTTGPLWHFTTTIPPNQPPYIPSNPLPVNGSTSVSINADLSWVGGDPDTGDTVTYDVYFGSSSSPSIVSHNQSSLSYDPGTLAYSTTYYWKIVSWDNHGASTAGPLWHFTTGAQPNLPPYVPSSPVPSNGSTDVSITIDLGWVGGDPNAGDTVTYDVYFGTSSTPPHVVGNQSAESYDPGTLAYSTLYYWRIVSWDNHGASTAGPLWHFTTGAQPDQPPNIPSNPSPVNGSTDISINTDVNWVGGDPDPGDTVTYDVHFGTTSSPPIVSHNQSSLSYDPGTLAYATTYYWKIVAWDNHGTSTTGPHWQFKTTTNRPPYAPSNPNPANGSTEIPINSDLSWTGGDPDSGDYVIYDVYFGSSFPLTKIKSNASGTTCTVTNLNYSRKYYWQVIAWDTHHNTNASPLWSFTTKMDLSPPSIKLTSPSLGYININIGDFIIKKIPIFITTIVIGRADVITTVTDSQSGVNRVEFYLDDILKASFTTGPYSWAWTERGFMFPYTLKIIAYDNVGNHITSETKIWKIF